MTDHASGPAAPRKAEPSLAEELDAMLKEAGLRACLCFVCSHKREHGPCGACGCKNDGTLGVVQPARGTPSGQPPRSDSVGGEAAELRALLRRVVKVLPRPWMDGGVAWKDFADTMAAVDVALAAPPAPEPASARCPRLDEDGHADIWRCNVCEADEPASAREAPRCLSCKGLLVCLFCEGPRSINE